ncbi:MGMT family protein, partial [bacterium]|nr:MGMT family protein [bacterium]
QITKNNAGKIDSISYCEDGAPISVTDLMALSSVDLNWDRVTDFQRRVYQELMAIGVGQTISYRDLAARVGRPNGARAIGNAMAKNPFLIVVPCHRVIESNGGLGGFASGLDVKRALLAAEGWLAHQ